jgi:hypothetical protein
VHIRAPLQYADDRRLFRQAARRKARHQAGHDHPRGERAGRLRRKLAAAKQLGLPGDVGEETLRELLLPLGVVDIKVCAVSAVWSGLKFMWRRK